MTGPRLVGLELPMAGDVDTLVAAARAAERAAFDGLWVRGRADVGVTLARLAAATTRVHLGVLVADDDEPPRLPDVPTPRRAAPITLLDGDHATLARVARDAAVWADLPRALAAHEATRDALLAACGADGRDPATLGHALVAPLLIADREKDVRDQLERALAVDVPWARAGAYVQGTPDVVVPRLRDYGRLGVTTFVLVLPDPCDCDHLAYVGAEVVAALHAS